MDTPDHPDTPAKPTTPTIKSTKSKSKSSRSLRLRLRLRQTFPQRPAAWLRTALEQGPEQVLPWALLVGLLSSLLTLAASASMLVLHLPVHTVLCRAQGVGPHSSTRQSLACYPNFFVATWLLVAGAAVLSGLFYSFLCVQHQQLRLRQTVAMLGSIVTMVLWLATMVAGFLPAQVGVLPPGIPPEVAPNVRAPNVRAYGMLSSSVENYMYAHNKTRMPALTGLDHHGPAKLIWVIGGGSGGINKTSGKPPGVITAIYRHPGNVFSYTVDNVPEPQLNARRVDGPKQKQQQQQQQVVPSPGILPTGPSKMVGKQRHNSPPAAQASRVEQIYARKTFFQDETKMALAAAIMTPISFVVSFNIFLLLSAFPFI